MSPIPNDTDPRMERVQIRLLAAAPVHRRVGLALSLTATVRRLSMQALAERFPEETPRQLRLRYVEFSYGAEIARKLAAALGSDND